MSIGVLIISWLHEHHHCCRWVRHPKNVSISTTTSWRRSCSWRWVLSSSCILRLKWDLSLGLKTLWWLSLENLRIYVIIGIWNSTIRCVVTVFGHVIDWLCLRVHRPFAQAPWISRYVVVVCIKLTRSPHHLRCVPSWGSSVAVPIYSSREVILWALNRGALVLSSSYICWIWRLPLILRRFVHSGWASFLSHHGCGTLWTTI